MLSVIMRFSVILATAVIVGIDGYPIYQCGFPQVLSAEGASR